MPDQAVAELREFHRFLTDQLNGAGVDWSPEQALDEWRRLHPDSQTAEEEVAAIRAALDDWEAGDRGVPFGDFDRDFRKRHHLPDTP